MGPWCQGRDVVIRFITMVTIWIASKTLGYLVPSRIGIGQNRILWALYGGRMILHNFTNNVTPNVSIVAQQWQI